jgi:hypothetical protein
LDQLAGHSDHLLIALHPVPQQRRPQARGDNRRRLSGPTAAPRSSLRRGADAVALVAVRAANDRRARRRRGGEAASA